MAEHTQEAIVGIDYSAGSDGALLEALSMQAEQRVGLLRWRHVISVSDGHVRQHIAEEAERVQRGVEDVQTQACLAKSARVVAPCADCVARRRATDGATRWCSVHGRSHEASSGRIEPARLSLPGSVVGTLPSV